MNEALQQDLAAVGIEVTLKPIEWASMLGEVVDGKFPAGRRRDEHLADLPAGVELGPLTSAPNGPINIGHYSNPKVDALLAEAQTHRRPEGPLATSTRRSRR